MRIQSFASVNLFWRAFNKGDTSFSVGVAEGIISPGQHVDWNHAHGALKLELKVENLWGAVILAPGRVHLNDDGVEVRDSHYVVQTRVFLPNL